MTNAAQCPAQHENKLSGGCSDDDDDDDGDDDDDDDDDVASHFQLTIGDTAGISNIIPSSSCVLTWLRPLISHAGAKRLKCRQSSLLQALSKVQF